MRRALLVATARNAVRERRPSALATRGLAGIQMMRSTIEAIWPVFDADGSGSIERNEFLLPGDGPQPSCHGLVTAL